MPAVGASKAPLLRFVEHGTSPVGHEPLLEARYMDAPPKVAIVKIGFDGHDRGSRVVASHLRDRGMEVIYTAPWQEIAQVVALVRDEDVDVLGVSTLATDHLIIPRLMRALSDAGLDDVSVVVGGIVPLEDRTELLDAGVCRNFGPGSPLDEISTYIFSIVRAARAAKDEEGLAGDHAS
jgi:methylmalonyl-CoA mutase, C-terminal domain